MQRTLNNKFSPETKMKFDNTRSENWVITKSNERRMQCAEMMFLRSVAGYEEIEKETLTYERN